MASNGWARGPIRKGAIVELSGLDYAVFILYMVVVLLVGFWVARRETDVGTILPGRSAAALVRHRGLADRVEHLHGAVHRRGRVRVPLRAGRGELGMGRLPRDDGDDPVLRPLLHAAADQHDARVAGAPLRPVQPVHVRHHHPAVVRLHQSRGRALRRRPGPAHDLRGQPVARGHSTGRGDGRLHDRRRPGFGRLDRRGPGGPAPRRRPAGLCPGPGGSRRMGGHAGHRGPGRT